MFCDKLLEKCLHLHKTQYNAARDPFKKSLINASKISAYKKHVLFQAQVLLAGIQDTREWSNVPLLEKSHQSQYDLCLHRTCYKLLEYCLHLFHVHLT